MTTGQRNGLFIIMIVRLKANTAFKDSIDHIFQYFFVKFIILKLF